MKLTGSMIGTEDSKKLGDFYTKILGKPMMNDGGWYGWKVGDGWLTIGLHSEVKGKAAEPARNMLMFEVDDVKGEFDRIKGEGADVIAEPYQPSKDDTPDMWMATFADPDGNYFQIATPWKEK